MVENSVVKVAVIGAGAISSKGHIPCYQKNVYARVVAVVDPNIEVAKKVSKKYGIKSVFSSVKDLFESSTVDALSICTPPNTHAEIVQEALERNVDVLCEKPLAENFESGRKIVDVTMASDNFVMMGFNRRFHSSYVQARRISRGGLAGHIYLAEYSSLQGSPLMGWTKSSWHYEEGVGGCLNDQGSHVFDMLNWFLGEPISVLASGSTHSESAVDEFCVAAVEYDKSFGIGEMSWLSSSRIESLVLHGTGRSMYVSPGPRFFLDINPSDILETSLWKSSSKTLVNTIKQSLFPRDENSFQKEIDYFIHCVRQRRKPYLDAAVGLKALAVTEAAKQSMKKETKIHVSSFR
jgi:UDP-N-acetylglucosamine 3-dehydrogenase